jgi:periplasmic copper chaperone A
MRPRTLIAPVAAVALLLAPAAAAHVTVNPNKVAADSFARFAIRVPNERPNADTTKVTVRLPQGLFFVAFQPKPGWKRTVTMQKLNSPATVFGEKVTERVATVTWEGGRIAPGEFDEFGMSAKVPNAAGRTLVFPALQTYSNGEVVRWIGPPDADEPASRVTLGAKEEEGAAAQPSSQTASSAEESAGGDDSEGRANLALGFGSAGLVAGLAALGLTLVRRRA